MIEKIQNGAYERAFAALYADTDAAARRWLKAAERFSRLYGRQASTLISAPGRTEIGGNHTDHQQGRALAAAVDLDIICVCAKNDEHVIRLQSDGFGLHTVALSPLAPREGESATPAALIRGVAAWLQRHGYTVGGFDAYIHSAVPPGSGLSSSAAFETTLGHVFASLYQNKLTSLEIAQAGQYAENKYFGKPCGLLDQTASSEGGLVLMDFADPACPEIEHIPVDLTGYELCVTDTKGSHAALTDEYAAIPADMRRVARHFGEESLSGVHQEDFYRQIADLRQYGDRAVLRALHFFEENERVLRQAQALKEGRLSDFLMLVNESGRSSALCLQNIFALSNPGEQSLTLALARSETILCGRGASRVHGGGFAGTIQAYVPSAMRQMYQAEMERIFGEGCCHFLKIRLAGGLELKMSHRNKAC